MQEILAAFPEAPQGSLEQRSPKDPLHNCIAFALGDTQRWWWPSTRGKPAFWPRGIRREASIAAFAALFASFGYERCNSTNVEAGYTKIALYARGVKPTHAAKQLPNGNWASKMGSFEDIEHTLDALRGKSYGRVVRLFRKPMAHGAH
jgi:hypothetical protein